MPPGSPSVSELITRYQRCAIAWAKALDRADHRGANEAMDELTALVGRLEEHGPEGLQALTPLLGHAEPSVRLHAAYHLLGTAAAACVPVLEELSRLPTLTGFSAGEALRRLRGL